ncbi:MAG: (d)CMP kinase [Chloroflexi bacterium]|nr:(d)CMP kinase [Chloroflexota bacterium]
MPTSPGSVPSRRPVIAVDGPGSSGKTSVGAAAAARLGLRFCDTGLFYRAVTFAARQLGIGEIDVDRLVALVAQVRLEVDSTGRYAVVTLDGTDITADVIAPDVDAAVSTYARVPELRAALLPRQREIAAEGGVVMAGRDIGTVVLPDADLKVFLDASVEERARRRADERGIAPSSQAAMEILDQLRVRDDIDASRSIAPLRRADDAVTIRTDAVSFAATVDQLVAAIEAVGRAPRPLSGDVPRQSAPTAARLATAGRSGRVARRAAIDPTPIATRITWIIRIASFVIRVIARFFTEVVIEGDVDAIPRSGAVLVAANHASNADPVLIGGFLNGRLGRPMNWMGKRELFDWPVISWLARHGGIHPLDRGAADVEGFRTAMRILDRGNILAVFPEGTRSPDGKLMAAKDGVAVLATRSGALIVPIGVIDSDRLWPRGRRIPVRTPRVTVRIGEPFYLADVLAAADARGTEALAAANARGTEAVAVGDARGTEAPNGSRTQVDGAGRPSSGSRRRSNAAGTDVIMRRIAALLPPRQQGAYGPWQAD